ncbi:uncharacterized protein [Oryza sativa Japonica Group]|uniref:uncharacterized protein n=1 Tax=Oryza sativa subsp. japonica TaxID=39947 RepID=UPI00339C9148
MRPRLPPSPLSHAAAPHLPRRGGMPGTPPLPSLYSASTTSGTHKYLLVGPTDSHLPQPAHPPPNPQIHSSPLAPALLLPPPAWWPWWRRPPSGGGGGGLDCSGGVVLEEEVVAAASPTSTSSASTWPRRRPGGGGGGVDPAGGSSSAAAEPALPLSSPSRRRDASPAAVAGAPAGDVPGCCGGGGHHCPRRRSSSQSVAPPRLPRRGEEGARRRRTHCTQRRGGGGGGVDSAVGHHHRPRRRVGCPVPLLLVAVHGLLLGLLRRDGDFADSISHACARAWQLGDTTFTAQAWVDFPPPRVLEVVEELVSQLRSEGLRRDAVLRDTSAFFLVGTRKQRSTSSHCLIGRMQITKGCRSFKLRRW